MRSVVLIATLGALCCTAAMAEPGAPFSRTADDEETVYAVQRKAYLIRNKFELSVSGAMTFSDRFVNTYGAGGALTYHVRENLAVELAGFGFFPDESSATDGLLTVGDLTPEIAKLTQLRWAAGVGLQWAPVYGKMQVFGAYLGNFGFYAVAGAGLGGTRVQCTGGRQLDPAIHGQDQFCEMQVDAMDVSYEPDRLVPMVNIGAGFRFFFADWVGVRLEVRDWIFPASVYRPEGDQNTAFTDTIRNNLFFTFGASFLLGGESN